MGLLFASEVAFHQPFPPLLSASELTVRALFLPAGLYFHPVGLDAHCLRLCPPSQHLAGVLACHGCLMAIVHGFRAPTTCRWGSKCFFAPRGLMIRWTDHNPTDRRGGS